MQEFDSQRKSQSKPPALPHNLEAEQALLGALLFDNVWLERIPAITPGMFFDPVHGRIYAAIVDMIRAGRTVDAIALRDRFAQDDGLHEIGGAGYLLTLQERAGIDSLRSASYAESIRDTFLRREVFRSAQETALAALEPERDIAESIRAGERSLASLMVGGKSWVSVREAGEQIVRDLHSPAPMGLRSGLSKLDTLLGGGLYAPDFIVVAGRPAMGKTALADNLATNVSSGGKVVGFFSMEMDPPQIAARVLARRSGKFKYSSLRSFEDRPSPELVAPYLSRLPETLLIDPTGAQTLAGIEASARAMRRQMGQIDLILVDYLQLMRDAAARRDGRVQEVSEITAGLKALAKRLGCPVVALSQLSRAVENRQDKRPILSDLRESGTIEQDADIVLFIYREHYYLSRDALEPFDDETDIAYSKRREAHDFKLARTANEVDVITGKNRHAQPGTEQLWCDLSMDMIADDWPDRTPHASRWGQDGVS